MLFLMRGMVAVVGSVVGSLLMAPVVLGIALTRSLTWLTGVLARTMEPTTVDWPDLLEFDAHLGWRPRPSMDVHCLSSADPEVFRVITDVEGWPGLTSFEESDLVVVGDSFAFGYSIDFPRAYASRLPGIRVKPLAAPGYSMVQGLMLMRTMQERLRGKLVIWMVYYGNDLIDNLVPRMNRYRSPFLRQAGEGGDWEVVTHHVRPEPWRVSAGKGSQRERIDQALHEVGPFSDRAFSACEALVTQAASCLRAVDAELMLLTIPSARLVAGKQSGGERRTVESSRVPDDALSKIGGVAGVHVVHASRFLTKRHFRPTDAHWNEDGHERIAQEIRMMYQTFSSRSGDSMPEAVEAPLV